MLLLSRSFDGSPPDQDVTKLKFDDFVILKRGVAAFMLRNYECRVIGAGAFNLDGVTISMADAVGLREELRFVGHKGLQNIVVKRDSKLIICAIQGR